MEISEVGIRDNFIQAHDDLKILVFPEIDSTNSEAKRETRAGDVTGPTLLVANEQTRGYGRTVAKPHDVSGNVSVDGTEKHSFYSPKDTGIYMTLAWPLKADRSDEERENELRVTAKTAVAVVNGLSSAVPLDYRIKWVNDIYVGTKKICGILVERVSDTLIIGIGINVTTEVFPENIEHRAGALLQNAWVRAESETVNRNYLIAPIVEALVEELENIGDTEYLNLYRRASNVLGHTVTINDITGTAIEINDMGALVVMTPDLVTHTISTGEILVDGEKI